MRLNVANRNTETTHEGAPAARMTPEQALRRSVLSCLLWEREFYEDGQEIAARIETLAGEVPAATLAALAVEAREAYKLRHVPLLLTSILAKSGGPIVGETVERVIQRADELTELLAIYWRGGKRPLSKQLKVGLAKAFRKFDAYALAKYDRANAVRLRDVLFLTHAKPKDAEQAALWAKLAANELESPDTWEVALSGGADKRETFERLIREGQLGYLALLRNLRNMAEAGCDPGLVRDAIVARKGAQRVLPFRYVAAARAAPQFEPALDQALSEAIAGMPVLDGKTVVMVDVSGSMDDKLSAKSDLTRKDAAATLASIIPGDLRVFTFADDVTEVPPRRGMAGIDAIRRVPSGGTRLFDAIAAVNAQVPYDRIIVITDEQAFGSGVRFGYYVRGNLSQCPPPKGKGYMINVASAKNGVGYGPWVHIDGFSEAVLTYIGEYERSGA
jgi:hypothetical protein